MNEILFPFLTKPFNDFLKFLNDFYVNTLVAINKTLNELNYEAPSEYVIDYEPTFTIFSITHIESFTIHMN